MVGGKSKRASVRGNDRHIKSSFLHKPTYLLQSLEKEKALPVSSLQDT